MKSPTFSIVFAAAFAIAYLVAVQNNYALFTYHPALGAIGWGVEPVKDGPAMYWYGWLATAGIAAALFAAIASWLAQRAIERAAAVAWIVPLAAMAAFAWLLRGYFIG